MRRVDRPLLLALGLVGFSAFSAGLSWTLRKPALGAALAATTARWW
jgi:hypothetical protein